MTITSEQVAEFAGHYREHGKANWHCADFVGWTSECPNMQTAVEMERLLVKLAELGLGVQITWLRFDKKWRACIYTGVPILSGEAVYNAVEAYLEWKAVQDD